MESSNTAIKSKKRKKGKPKVSAHVQEQIVIAIGRVMGTRMPYKLRIDKDLFIVLRRKLPQEAISSRVLRAAISGGLYYLCNKMPYLRSVATSNYRYGIRGEKYPMEKKHRDIAIKKLASKSKRKQNKNGKLVRKYH